MRMWIVDKADPEVAALGAIVGICVALVICVIALIVFVIVFCNLKIKNDNNIRKRVIANDAFDEVKTVQEAQSVDTSSSFLNIAVKSGYPLGFATHF